MKTKAEISNLWLAVKRELKEFGRLQESPMFEADIKSVFDAARELHDLKPKYDALHKLLEDFGWREFDMEDESTWPEHEEKYLIIWPGGKTVAEWLCNKPDATAFDWRQLGVTHYMKIPSPEEFSMGKE